MVKSTSYIKNDNLLIMIPYMFICICIDQYLHTYVYIYVYVAILKWIESGAYEEHVKGSFIDHILCTPGWL